MKKNEKIGMFNPEASEFQLKVRNYLLGIIRVILWGTFIVSAGWILIKNGFSFDFRDGNYVNYSWYIVAGITVTLSCLFEFWVIDYWSSYRCATGKEWVTNWYGSSISYQKKFFTFQYHYYSKNHNNPLW